MSAEAKEATPPLAEQPKQAAKEVIAGQPGPTARRWLGPTALVVFILFAIDTYVVVNHLSFAYDLTTTMFIQQFNWGPLVYPMELINISASSVAARLAEHELPWMREAAQVALTAAVMVPVMLIAGEMTPKSLAIRVGEPWASMRSCQSRSVMFAGRSSAICRTSV